MSTEEGQSQCQEPQAETLSEIGDNDVLCGRGKRSYMHIGNIRFRKIVLDHIVCGSQEATGGGPFRKAMAMEIIREVQRKGGNFLKPVECNNGTKGNFTWEMAPKEVVLSKVKQALRDVSASINSNTKAEEERKKPPRMDHAPTTHNTSSVGAAAAPAPLASAFVPYQLDGSNSQQQRAGIVPVDIQAMTMMSQVTFPQQNAPRVDHQALTSAMATIAQRRAAEATLFQHWQQQQSAVELIALLTQQRAPYPVIPPNLAGLQQTQASASIPLLGSTIGVQLPAPVTLALPTSERNNGTLRSSDNLVGPSTAASQRTETQQQQRHFQSPTANDERKQESNGACDEGTPSSNPGVASSCIPEFSDDMEDTNSKPQKQSPHSNNSTDSEDRF